MEQRDGFFKHQIKSFGYAFEGIFYSFRKGTHFKFHILATALVIILGFIYSVSVFEWLILILISSAIIASEAINTAVEETCNLLQPDIHPRFH